MAIIAIGIGIPFASKSSGVVPTPPAPSGDNTILYSSFFFGRYDAFATKKTDFTVANSSTSNDATNIIANRVLSR